MKRILAVFLLALAGIAMAGPTDPNDIRVVQNNANIPSNGTLTRYVAFPGGAASCLLVLDGASTLPACASIGSGISYSGGTLTATATGTVTSITAGTGLSGGTITSTGTISLPSTGTAGTYSGITTDAQGRVTAGTTRSFSYTTRALNTCFQPSATRDTFVTYAVDISASLSLSGGTVGTVYLRTYTNSTCTTGAQEVTRFVNGNTGALTIGLNTVQNATGTLSGIIPAGLWVQQVTENTTGTPAFTARPGQEVAL